MESAGAATVPTAARPRARRADRSRRRQATGNSRRSIAEIDGKIVTGHPTAVAIEQYRRLAATLHQAQTERGIKTLMITSAVPNEGKTLTATNLALTLSESYGLKVLLIRR